MRTPYWRVDNVHTIALLRSYLSTCSCHLQHDPSRWNSNDKGQPVKCLGPTTLVHCKFPSYQSISCGLLGFNIPGLDTRIRPIDSIGRLSIPKRVAAITLHKKKASPKPVSGRIGLHPALYQSTQISQHENRLSSIRARGWQGAGEHCKGRQITSRDACTG